MHIGKCFLTQKPHLCPKRSHELSLKPEPSRGRRRVPRPADGAIRSGLRLIRVSNSRSGRPGGNACGHDEAPMTSDPEATCVDGDGSDIIRVGSFSKQASGYRLTVLQTPPCLISHLQGVRFEDAALSDKTKCGLRVRPMEGI